MKFYEFRDPIHGFIQINEWEREIVNHWVFQRLRRIKQLAMTDMVYPGATHSRFEHSLGVMHVATEMFNSIVKKNKDFLSQELNFTDDGIGRDRVIVRIASLLHDIGHAPFSHAGEDLFPINPELGKHYKHEDYSAAIIRHFLKDVIEDHPLNQNYCITADDISDFLIGKPRMKRSLLWRNLIIGQLDADRADYLLRDSYHIGVKYGKYDLNRILVTLTLSFDDNHEPVIAVEEGGWHAAEGLVIARYMMFTQVYFQHTRRAYDHHLSELIRCFLEIFQGCFSGCFYPPTDLQNLKSFLEWDDWQVLGLICSGYGGENAEIIKKRKHYRWIYQTNEVPTVEEIDRISEICHKLDFMPFFIDSAEKSWYKFGKEDIPVVKSDSQKVVPLSVLSDVVKGLSPVKQMRVYVPNERRAEAKKAIN